MGLSEHISLKLNADLSAVGKSCLKRLKKKSQCCSQEHLCLSAFINKALISYMLNTKSVEYDPIQL